MQASAGIETQEEADLELQQQLESDLGKAKEKADLKLDRRLESVLRNARDFVKLLDIALRSAIVDKELSE